MTITPAFNLIAIAFPSFRLLYLLDEVYHLQWLKRVGHQWFEAMEYSDFLNEMENRWNLISL